MQLIYHYRITRTGPWMQTLKMVDRYYDDMVGYIKGPFKDIILRDNNK